MLFWVYDLKELQDDYISFRDAKNQMEEIKNAFKTYVKDFLFDNKVAHQRDLSDSTDHSKIVFHLVLIIYFLLFYSSNYL